MVAAGVTGSALAMPLLAATGANAADAPTWDRVAQCESGGTWSTNSGNGSYGGLQMTQELWEQYGGRAYAPRPDLASRQQQIAVAEQVLNAGASPWQACGSAAGLAKDGKAPEVTPGSTKAPTDDAPAPRAPERTPSAPATGGSAPSDSTASPAAPASPSANPDAKPSPGTPSPSAGDRDGKPEGGKHRKDPSGPTSGPANSPTTGPTTGPTGDPTEIPTSGAPSTQKPADPSTGTPAPADSASPHAPSTDSPETGSGQGSGQGSGSGSGKHRAEPPRSGDEGRASRGGGDARTDKPAAGDYTVRPGDNLSVIAEAHSVNGGWQSLYQRNEKVVGSDPDLILPGQRLEVGK
ncbi:transglycosylase family protein [Streptomyces sp. NPDC051162]|uniref:transglycosylase family protein n=1 Tax=unclassified Streptomyces TaxID=2593676 RepID=UPI00341BFEA2